MARIRTIKPEFWTSEDIADLSPLARLLYIALWGEADREGRMKWKPRAFRIRYLPLDQCDINAVCEELTQRKLVVLYGQSNEFAHIPSFHKHQRPHTKEAESTLPPPPSDHPNEENQSKGDGEPQPRCAPATTQVVRDHDLGDGSNVGKEREGKGKEEYPPTPQGGEGLQSKIASLKTNGQDTPESLALEFVGFRQTGRRESLEVVEGSIRGLISHGIPIASIAAEVRAPPNIRNPNERFFRISDRLEAKRPSPQAASVFDHLASVDWSKPS